MKCLIASAAAAMLLAPQQTDTPEENEALPLEATGTIEFTTDEVTWMSLDVSPDGSTVVFDLLGDLYTLPITGGEATRIFGDMSFESQPTFSPDGETIAFLSDRSGRVRSSWRRPRGRPTATTCWCRSRVHPSERSACSCTTKTVRPACVSVPRLRNRSRSNRVNGARGLPTSSARWRRPTDASSISVSGSARSTNNAQFPIWQIMRFDRETSETATITNAQGSAMRPVLSPDGSHLVFATRFRTQTGLRVRNLETGAERWLIYPVTRDDQESRASRDTMPGYAFVPDGTGLVVPIGGKLHLVDFATGAAQGIPFTAEVAAEIGPRIHFDGRVDDSDTVEARVIRWPALSPAGDRLAFSAFNRIWVMDLPGGTPQRLTDLDVGEFMPSWSRDGGDVVFVTWSTEGGHIYRGSPGGVPERLTEHPSFYAEPVYTPAGDRIVFITGNREDQLYSISNVYQDEEIRGVRPTGTTDLRFIPATGGGATLIAATQGGRFPHFAPHFLNDPERVYLTTSEGLASVRLDGFDRKTHFKVTGRGPGPTSPPAAEIALSPDGHRAFVNLQNRHYLVSIPRVGKEVLEIKITPDGDAAVPVTELSSEGGNYLGWSSDGSELLWSRGQTFYRQTPTGERQPTDVVVQAERPKPHGTVVLRGAERIITMRGGDEVLAGGDIVITDNRITAVGVKAELPAGAQVIDVSGKTIMPGLVDAHAHMWAPRQMHQTQVWQYLANLAYGVTTTRDPQTSTDDVFAYADLVESGQILGPRIYATGPGVFATSGVSDQEAADNLLARYAEAYDSRTIKQYVVGDRIVRQWVAIASRKHGLTPTTEGALDLKLDLTQMADGYSGHEHSLPIIPIYDDVANYVAKTETYYTPTILVAYGGPWTENYFFQNTDVSRDEKLARFIPYQLLDNMVRRRGQWFVKEEYVHPRIAEGCARIVRAGGKCCLGSHGQLQGIGAHWETWALQSGGLTEHETLRAVTLHSAEAIGLFADVGSLVAGKLADILVLDRNPLENIENTNTVRYVMKNGELFEAATLDQIWPERKRLPDQFWWGDMPKPTTVDGGRQ